MSGLSTACDYVILGEVTQSKDPQPNNLIPAVTYVVVHANFPSNFAKELVTAASV